MHLLRLIGICTQIIGGRYDQTRTDTAINNLWYSDDRYLDEAADALEAQAKEIEKLRTALELVMRHVALALPKDVCAIANEALKGLA